MDLIIRGLTFLLIPVIVSGVFSWLRQPKAGNAGEVYLPKFFVIIGTITSVFFLIPALITTVFSDEPMGVSVLFLLLALVGASLVIAFINCRISYDQDGFVSKNFFGVKRKYTYEDVTAIKENVHEKYIYVGKGRIMVDEFSIGGEDFVKLVKTKYRTIHGGKSLPRRDDKKYDIFNGNVRDAGGFLIVYGLVAATTVGFLLFTVYNAYLSPSTTTNTIEQTVCFMSCAVLEDEIVLTSEDHLTYKISFTDEEFDAKAIQDICSGETRVTVYSKKVSQENEDEYYSIKAIMHNGGYLLSFVETNKLRSQEYRPMILIALAMCLAWGLFVAASIVVGRNPQRFSKRVVHWFFKAGYVNR